MKRINNTEYFITSDGVKYKRTINEGKTWWYVSHNDEEWMAISGCPSVVLYPEE